MIVTGLLLFMSMPFLRASAGAVLPPSVDPPGLMLGMSTALTGSLANVGRDMKLGVEAALAEANQRRGIGGRPVLLTALDDGYEPSRAGPNVHTLIDSHRSLAIVGNVGTPTAVAAIPVAIQHRTAFFGAFTGAGLLRKDPPDECVINFRASYAEETGAMVDALVNEAGIKPEEIAFFTQRDAYGDAGFAGGVAALKRHGLSTHVTILHGRYERNTLAVENGLADMLASPRDPKAVIVVGAYAPSAKLVTLAHRVGFRPLFLNVSFVGAPALAAAAGAEAEGVIVTQVVPPPESALPLAVEYRAALAAYHPEAEPNHVSFEGYVVGRIMLLALERAGPDAGREQVIDSLLSLGTFDIGMGQTLTLDRQHHQACRTVWASVIEGGRVRAMEWSELRSRLEARR